MTPLSRREKLERLLEQDPNDAFLHFGLAMELAKEGLVQEALARFDHVLSLDPANIATYDRKASILFDLGRSDDARAALEAGIEAARRAGDSHAADNLKSLLDASRR